MSMQIAAHLPGCQPCTHVAPAHQRHIQWLIGTGCCASCWAAAGCGARAGYLLLDSGCVAAREVGNGAAGRGDSGGVHVPAAAPPAAACRGAPQGCARAWRAHARAAIKETGRNKQTCMQCGRLRQARAVSAWQPGSPACPKSRGVPKKAR